MMNSSQISQAALLPLRALQITLEFVAPAHPRFFHQPALTAFLRFLLDSPPKWDTHLVIDAVETGRVAYRPGDAYRFAVYALAGGEALLQTLLDRLRALPGSARKAEPYLPFRDNLRFVEARDLFTANPISTVAELSPYDLDALNRESRWWAEARAALRWRWLSPVQFLRRKEERQGAKGNARYCRNAEHLDGPLLVSRVQDAIQDLCRRRVELSLPTPSPWQGEGGDRGKALEMPTERRDSAQTSGVLPPPCPPPARGRVLNSPVAGQNVCVELCLPAPSPWQGEGGDGGKALETTTKRRDSAQTSDVLPPPCPPPARGRVLNSPVAGQNVFAELSLPAPSPWQGEGGDGGKALEMPTEHRDSAQTSGVLPPPCPPPSRILDSAAPSVTLEETQVFWLDTTYRDAQGKEQAMGGLTGLLNLHLPAPLPEEVWHALVLGQYLGVGQRRSFGWGRYRLETPDGARTCPRAVPATSFLERSVQPGNLEEAYAAIRANRRPFVPKAPADEDEFEPWTFDQADEAPADDVDLERLAERLRTGRWQAPPLRVRVMQEADGELRVLNIPPFIDRVAQRAVAQALSPGIEQLMYPQSHGYRPGHSRHTAAYAIQSAYRAGYRWVYESDVDDYFDSVNLDHLHHRLIALYGEDPVVSQVMAWIGAPLDCEGKIIERQEGLPQGSPLSPLLANLMLDDFDNDMEAAGFRLVRFADDFVVLCKNAEQAQAADREVRRSLAELGLNVNPEKTRIVPFEQGFRYLGYLFLNELVLDVAGKKGGEPRPKINTADLKFSTPSPLQGMGIYTSLKAQKNQLLPPRRGKVGMGVEAYRILKAPAHDRRSTPTLPSPCKGEGTCVDTYALQGEGWDGGKALETTTKRRDSAQGSGVLPPPRPPIANGCLVATLPPARGRVLNSTVLRPSIASEPHLPPAWLARLGSRAPRPLDEKSIRAMPTPVTPPTGVPLREGERSEAGTLLCVTGDPALLLTRLGRLLVERDEKTVVDLPWGSLEAVLLIGAHHVTGPALRAALSHRVPLHFASVTGYYQGTLWDGQPAAAGHGLWLRQQARFADPSAALEAARNLMDSRLRHLREVLRQLERAPELEAEREAIERGLAHLPEAVDLAALNGLEGAATRAFFAAVQRILPQEWGFEGRERRPPRDPFNSLLSLGYTMLYAHVDSILRVDGLLPWCGFYHQGRGRHAALASDLMEPFRHLIERTALNALLRRLFKPEDFVEDAELGCRLSREARRRYLGLLVRRFDAPITALDGATPVTVYEHLHRQNLALIDWIEGRAPFHCWRTR